MEETRYHKTCLNTLEAISYTYWDECNKCKNGMWSCGRNCETKKTGIKYRCKFCCDENIYWIMTINKKEMKEKEEKEEERKKEMKEIRRNMERRIKKKDDERMIYRFLINNKYNLGIKILLYQYVPFWNDKKYTYDFYIKLINGKRIILECDDKYHYTINQHIHKNGRTLEKQQDRDIFKMNKALENDVSVIRIHQEDVYNDIINWKKEITDAIDEIKNEDEVSVKVLGCLKKDTDVCWEFD